MSVKWPVTRKEPEKRIGEKKMNNGLVQKTLGFKNYHIMHMCNKEEQDF